MYLVDSLNSISLCTGLKENNPIAITQGKLYVYYLILNSARTSFTTRNYAMLGTNNRCIGVYHDAS